MSSPSLHLPPPRTYKDVPLISTVDPEDVKRVWNVKPPWTANSPKDACSPGADVSAVVKRRHMIDMLVGFKVLGPWTHDDQLDEAVFRLAATFPLHEQQFLDYKIPGDEYWPFDPNAFVQQLVEETGIAHVWEPVTTNVGEGGRGYVLHSVGGRGAVQDPERDARHRVRELLWNIWRRFSGFEQMVWRGRDSDRAELRAVLFADFLIANADLVQQVVETMTRERYVGTDLLIEIEQRAMRRI